jgi:POT family proton-dependent oligopeptide transporter
MGQPHLGDIGHLQTDKSPEEVAALSRRFFGSFAAIVAGIALFGFLVYNGTIPITITQIATRLGQSVLVLVAAYFVYVWMFGGHTAEENKRMGVIFWLFLLIAVFWSGFEQAGTSLNLFARDLTDRVMFGSEVPASWLQSINAGFIIVLAPIFGSVWVWLDARQANPSIPVKAGMGLLGLAMGFFVLAWGASFATPENPVSPMWLVVTYFLHTVGELCISPIGLSAITKLSPKRRVGQMMGVWFVGAALGNLFAGLVAGQLESLAPAALFRTVAMIIGGVGFIALVVSPGFKKLVGDLK